MLDLAENNHDHFLPFEKDAYLTGQQLAIEKAREASQYPRAVSYTHLTLPTSDLV